MSGSSFVPLLVLCATTLLTGSIVLFALCAFDRISADIFIALKSMFFSEEQEASPPTVESLISQPEQPIAIMFPVWRTGESLQRSVSELVSTLDYSSYHIFIGVCPNDTQSLREADSLRTQFNHVHRVVSENPGPPAFSEALAVLLDGVAEYEMASGIEFQGFVLGEGEDSYDPLSLRLFNHWLGSYGLIQIPRYSFNESRPKLIAGAFHDELAMRHGRDNELHAQLTDAINLSEVVTLFSRKVYQRILSEPWYQNENPVDAQRFFAWMHCLGVPRKFCRVSIDPGGRFRRRPAQQKRVAASEFIAVMASFPSRLGQALAYELNRFNESRRALDLKTADRSWWAHTYIAWRDLSNRLIACLSPVALICAGILAVVPDLTSSGSFVLAGLLQAIPGLQYAVLTIVVYVIYWLVLHHVWVLGTYGSRGLLMIIPRAVVGFVIRTSVSFLAIGSTSRRNVDGLQASLDARALLGPTAFSATTPPGNRIGEMLRARGLIDARDLQSALTTRAKTTVPLGRILLRQGKVTEEDLLEVIAEQTGWPIQKFEPLDIALAVTRLIPFHLMRRHRVFPVGVRIDGKVNVATYNIPSPGIRRELELAAGARLSFVLCKRSDVREGIRICARVHARLDESTLIQYEDRSIGWVVDQLDPATGSSSNESLQF